MRKFLLLTLVSLAFLAGSCQKVQIAPTELPAGKGLEPVFNLPKSAEEQMVLISGLVKEVSGVTPKTAFTPAIHYMGPNGEDWAPQGGKSFLSTLSNKELITLFENKGWEKVEAVCWELETWTKKIPGTEKAWFKIHLSQERQNHGYVKRLWVQRCTPQKGEIPHSDETQTIGWSGVEGFYRPLD